MKPLITIETVPISIEYVEKKSHHSSENQSAKLLISHQDDVMTIKSNPIHIEMRDSFETNPSMNWSNLSYTATAQYSTDGNLKMSVKMEDLDGSASTFVFQQFERGIENIVDFLPKASTSTPIKSESLHINFDMSHLSNGLQSVNNIDTSFLPPDLELKVLELPRVIIKYVGGPLYIPKSADPNYVPVETTNRIFDGKSIFDAKA